ncbi:MAG: phage shock protein A [Thermoproteota archaeon]|jgi:phage shock protein A
MFDSLKNLFNKIFQSEEQSMQKTLNNLENKSGQVNKALTQLYFNKEKLQQKIELIEDENKALCLDLNQACEENNDEVSLYLIDTIERNKEELSFLNEQFSLISKDVTDLVKNKKELGQNLVKYKELLTVYNSREIALRARRDLKKELGLLKNDISGDQFKDGLSQIKDKITFLNIELKQPSNEADQTLQEKLETMRQSRSLSQNQEKLDKIKEKIKLKKETIFTANA